MTNEDVLQSLDHMTAAFHAARARWPRTSLVMRIGQREYRALRAAVTEAQRAGLTRTTPGAPDSFMGAALSVAEAPHGVWVEPA